MKKVLFTLATISLFACTSVEGTPATHSDGCCKSTTDANDLPFEIDSITTVNQLLDSLSVMPSTHH